MSRHKQFYKDLKDDDYAAHPDEFYDQDDHEYEDTCLQCHNYALGHADPTTFEFYCQNCWQFYNASQQTTPNNPNKSKKKNKRNKKNKNANQSQQPSQPSNNNNNVSNAPNAPNAANASQNFQNPSNPTNSSAFSTPSKPVAPAAHAATAATAATEVNKDQILGDRPDFFGGFSDPAPPKTSSATGANANDGRPDFFASVAQPPANVSSPPQTSNTRKTPKTGANAANAANAANSSNRSNAGSTSQTPNKANKGSKLAGKASNKANDEKKEKDEGYTYEGIRFIGERLDSKKNYLKQQKLKESLIEDRFGINLNQTANSSKDAKKGANEGKDKELDKEDKGSGAGREKLLKKATKSKAHINLVVIGHVDAGKSTLMGHLLYKYGKVGKKVMHKNEKEANELNKSSFAYAFVLDVNEEERKRGITVDVSTNYFETENRRVTLLDSPGHKDFVPNMISGTSQADAAVLVINANLNEFEAGFSEKGQTREHALLAKSLGVQQLIVAVNKMDMIDWDFGRYKFIVEQLRHFLGKIGFENKKKKQNITFIPVSGLTGENLLRSQDIAVKDSKKGSNNASKDSKGSEDSKKAGSSGDDSWYRKESEFNTNLTLIELIDSLRPPSTVRFALDYPLRMSITDIYKEANLGGLVVSGKIYSGSIVAGQQILIQPINLVCKVKSLNAVEQSNNTSFQYKIGVSGDNIQLMLNTNLAGTSGKDSEMYFDQMKVGDMVTTPYEPIDCVKKFECKIATQPGMKVPFVKGQEVVVHNQSVDLPALMVKINGILDKKTGEIANKRARHVKADTTALVVIRLKNKKDKLCLDTFENHKQLGRVMIRREGETIAVGVVTQLM